MKKKPFTMYAAMTVMLGVAAIACAVTPAGTAFTYQGQLKQSGSPITGSVDCQFSLFAAPAGGSPINGLTLNQNLTATDGLFTTDLDFGAGALIGDERWLEIAVRFPAGSGNYTPLLPRQRLNPAPYALFALNAMIFGTQGGAVNFTNAANAFAGSGSGLTNLNASNINSGTLGSAQMSGAYSNAMNFNNASNVFTGSFSGGGTGLTNVNADLLDGLNSTAFLQSIPVPLDVSGNSLTHIIRGTNSSPGSGSIGVLGVSSATSGTTSGVFGLSASPSGWGVFGQNTATTGGGQGGHFESGSSAGIGVVGYNSAPSGTTYGGFFQTDSPAGRGVAGVGNNTGVYGDGGTYGVYGVGTSTGVYGSGAGYGVYAENLSTSGTAIYADARALSGAGIGVFGQSLSTSGTGVRGYTFAATGITYGVYGQANSTSGRGVYGLAPSASGTSYGVYGAANLAASGFAVFAEGDMGASGVKPFRIDHPDDPANKYLLHYAAESPEVINFYSGKVIIDAMGEAVVELPHYFAKINKDPRYLLTAVGASMPNLYVAKEIDDAALLAGEAAGPGEAALPCWFRIAGGVPGAKVCWRVEAVRNDRWVQERGAPVEIDKQDLERGTYQHPEFYGQPREKGLKYDAPSERPTHDIAQR